MARYVDADKLIAHLEDEIRECKPPQGGRAGGKSIAYGTMLGLKSAIAFADALTTADAAPRSEVAREIFGEMGATAFTMHDDDSGEFILCMYCEDFEEIKQKYTEEQK